MLKFLVQVILLIIFSAVNFKIAKGTKPAKNRKKCPHAQF